VNAQFDPAKNALNVSKHGVALAFGVEIFPDEYHPLLSSLRPIDGEE
jgi:uncharacterized DUF497 family protein